MKKWFLKFFSREKPAYKHCDHWFEALPLKARPLPIYLRIEPYRQGDMTKVEPLAVCKKCGEEK